MQDTKGSKFPSLVVSSAILLTIAGVGYFAYRYFIGKELTPLAGAAVIPQEAILTTFIETDTKAWSKLSQFGTPELKKLIGDELQKAEKQILAETGINYQKDIEPWVGNIMIAALPSPTPNEYKPLVVVGIKNKIEAWKFSNKLKQNNYQTTIVESSYQGINIIEVKDRQGKSLNTALLGDILVLSPERKTLEMAIDSFKGKPSFANKPNAKEILSEKLELKNSIAKIYLVAPNLGNVHQNLQNLPSVKSGIIGVGIEDEGIHLQSNFNFNANITNQEFKPVSEQLIEKFPSNTLALITGKGISQLWTETVILAEQYPELKQVLNELRESVKPAGFDLDRDIFAWMDGEYALGIVPSKQGVLADAGLGGGVILGTTNKPAAEGFLNKVSLLLQSNPFIAVNDQDIQGNKVTEYSTFQQQMIMSYGWLNDKSLLITFSSPFFNFLNQQGNNSLIKSERFLNATKALPRNNSGYFYVDLENTYLWVKNMGTPLPPEAVALASSLEAVVMTSSIPDKSTVKGYILLSLKKSQ